MSKVDDLIKQGVEVAGFITPTSSSDTYPTHLDNFGKGGVHSVTTLIDRNSIPLERRSEGMLCYVAEDDTMYQLLNNMWVGFKGELELQKGYVFVGDDNNKAKAVPKITMENLPELKGTNFPSDPLDLILNQEVFAGDVWRGTADGKVEASSALSNALRDLTLINGRFLFGNFILGDSHITIPGVDIDLSTRFGWPKSQFLVNTPDGVMMHKGATLETEIIGQLNHLVAWGEGNKIRPSTITILPDINGQNPDGLDGVGSLECDGDITCMGNIVSTGSINGKTASFTTTVFSGKSFETRDLILYDRVEQGADRLSHYVGFRAVDVLDCQILWTLPSGAGKNGQVLTTDANNILSFTYKAPHDAKFILQEEDGRLPHAQSLNQLGQGLLKNAPDGTLSIAIAGNDYLTPQGLNDAISPLANRVGAVEIKTGALQGEVTALANTVGTTAATVLLHTASLGTLGTTVGGLVTNVLLLDAGAVAMGVSLAGKVSQSTYDAGIQAVNDRIDNLQIHGGAGTVTSISAGYGVSTYDASGNPVSEIITRGQIGLSKTGVKAGSYTNADIKIDDMGRVLAASNGSSGGSGTNTMIGVGTTAQRPTNAPVGFIYFNTDYQY